MSTASATDFIISGNRAIVNGGHTTDFWWEDNGNLLTETTSSGIYTLVVEGCSLTANTDYGFKVKVNENAWNDGTTFPSDEYRVNVPYDGTYTLIYFVDIDNKGIRVIATPMLRWSLGNSGNGNWNWLYDSSAFFTKKGDFSWTFEVKSDDYTSDFSFRLYSAIFKKSAYPASQDLVLNYGDVASTSAYFNTAESTNYSWKLTKPSYDFEKVIITAVYNPFATNDGTWKVSADAYISKTVSATYDYATFGTSVPVDLSGVAAEGVTAYSVTANATTGKVTKTEKTDVLAANKGVLLENLTNADITLSLPVSAEAGGNETNDMIAFTGGSEKLSQTSKEDNNNYTHYILANESAGVGFYKVYSEGNSMGTNTAYLKVLTSVDAARSFLWFDESTGINAVEKAKIDGEAYNLAGQRVTNPTKGLYIVNGKKVIKN